jgi:hypothetical protein
MQVFTRPVNDTERENLELLRRQEEKLRAACAECLPLKLTCEPPSASCPRYRACVARHGVVCD